MDPAERRPESTVHDISFGTGYQIYQDTILDAIAAAQSEVILITCFWARSATLDALKECLCKLSATAQRDKRRVKVRIGFSSASLLQKLFHTSKPSGRTYDPSEWRSKLDLPDPADLAGLDIEVKSIFFLPFSVWHPKFVIVDQTSVVLPSCNVSWEDWFEGCMRLSGPIVGDFLDFWRSTWASERDRSESRSQGLISQYGSMPTLHPLPQSGMARIVATRMLDLAVPCTFLPSPHSRNPRFRLPWQRHASPPRTPLNRTLLDLLDNSQKSIFLQTPNVTSPPVLEALVDAIRRGVDVEIVTSERLMILEQLVTAGTTTNRCMQKMIRAYSHLRKRYSDEEHALVPLGRLLVSYYQPRTTSTRLQDEPVQSHVKLTIVDDEAMVFGSGNMDRASWYTSQEIGVVFYSPAIVERVKGVLGEAMHERSRLVFDSRSYQPH